jgi:hypothetical protein
MITENEFYKAVSEYPSVKVAFEKAVNAYVKMHEPKLGWFTLSKRTFEFSHAGSQLLTIFGTATGHRRPASDTDSLVAIVREEANMRKLYGKYYNDQVREQLQLMEKQRREIYRRAGQPLD